MRKIFPLFLFAVFWVLPVGAQNPPIPITTLTASGSSCVSGSTTAGSFLIVNITPAQGAASFTINANAGSNTISFYASGDGGKTYATLSVTPSNSTTTVTTSTGTGVWRASVAGYTNVCMLESTKSSGNTLVNIAPSTASAFGLGGGGGSGSGTVSGQANGVIPLATGATTIGAQSALSDNGSTVSSSEPIAVNAINGISGTMVLTAPSGSSLELIPGSGAAIVTAGQMNLSGDVFDVTGTALHITYSIGKSSFSLYSTMTNCAANGTAASPSVVACGSAAAGMFSCATTATTGTCQVNTTAVTANSEVLITPDDADGGASQLNVTCNTTLTTPAAKPILLSKSAGSNFIINLGTVTVNPACYEYSIIN